MIILRGPTKAEITEATELALKRHSNWVNEEIEIKSSGESYYIIKGSPERRIVLNPNRPKTTYITETFIPEIKVPYTWNLSEFFDRKTGKHIRDEYTMIYFKHSISFA